MEAMVALTISSVLVALIGTVFLVQNRFYADQLKLSTVHDNARTVTQVMGDALRSVMPDGITEAANKEITVRTPMVLTVVCGTTRDGVDVHMEGGEAGLDTAEVAGFALRDATTGAWSYYNALWTNINGPDGHAADHCAGNGADTTGATSEFSGLKGLGALGPGSPALGDILMIFRETRFKIQTSVLDTSTEGLFRASYGDTLIEYVTGLDTSAAFQYRTGGTSYSTSVTSGDLGEIDGVRVVAQASIRPETGTEGDIKYGWSVNFLLPNVR
jgi:hypothetical protein